MAEGFANFGVLQEKDTGHAHHVAGGKPHEVPAEERAERAQNTFRIQILPKLSADQAKGLIEARVGIAETRNVEQAIGREEPFGFFFGAEMDEGELDVLSFDRFTFFGDFGDGLAAEGAAEMAEKHEEKRAIGSERSERLAVLRGVGGQQRRVDLV